MDRFGMVDDTPVSSTVSTGAVRAGAVSAAQSELDDDAAPNTPARAVLSAPTVSSEKATGEASGESAGVPSEGSSEAGVTPVAPVAALSDAPPGQSGVAPARPSSPASPSALFEPTSEEEEFAVDSGWATLPEVERALPRLELAAAEPARLLYEKSQEPSDESPILYCERVFVVDSLQSDEELAEHLLEQLSSIRDGWSARDSSQFVQLAAFDHAFESEPQYPPIATLSWKDWQGRTELWVRGVRRSGPPPLSAELSGAQREPAVEAAGAEPSGALSDDAAAQATAEHRPRSGDSGTSWQSPARSGEYPIPTVDEPSPPPPSSQRMLAGEELIGALFERMNELQYLPDLAAGAAYVLETLEEFIPCAGISIHVLDPHHRQFVLVRALGPRASPLLGSRQAAAESPLLEAVQHGRTLRQPGSRNPLWAGLGLEIVHALSAPVQQRDRVFGAIELGRNVAQDEFSDGQLEALDFICEQFAEFLAERPFTSPRLP
jgi:hypothetical protein